MSSTDPYKPFYDMNIVVDVAPPVVFIGKLVEANTHYLTLSEVDAHDLRNTTVTKEVYIMEAARNGIQPNRKSIQIKLAEVLSFSCLDDVIIY